MEQFEHVADILVSSEVGGEGRNLQFCRTVVNYDLPWNPMQLEQRVGRVHRIGQTREVFRTLTDPEFAASVGLEAPPLTRFAARWGHTLLTVDEVRAALRKK